MNFIKKHSVIILSVIVLASCSYLSRNLQPHILGNKKATTSWVYLSGLTQSIESEQEQNNRHILDNIGKKLNIRIIAVPSIFRCAEFANKLCWPHKTPAEVDTTYSYIHSYVDTPIDGYIGFSNGGFFLHNFIQHHKISVPIITIGASGALDEKSTIDAKSITMIIGKQDEFHYDYALNLAKKLANKNVPVTVVEHEGGHEIPINVLCNALQKYI